MNCNFDPGKIEFIKLKLICAQYNPSCIVVVFSCLFIYTLIEKISGQIVLSVIRNSIKLYLY